MSKYKRIVIHHTAGGYSPNDVDLGHYPYLISGEGKLVRGIGIKGKFEHVGGLNSSSLGVAACCNYQFINKEHQGKYPLTKIQFEKICSFVASLCIKEGLEVTVDTVCTHYEIGKAVERGKIKKNKNTLANIGKIDITYLPFVSYVRPDEVGNYFRNKVAWYKNKLKG